MLVALVACQPPASRPHLPTPPPTPPPVVAVVPPPSATPAPSTEAPGCVPAERAARLRELELVTERLKPDTADAKAVLAELRAAVARPCLRHLEPAVLLPTGSTLASLRRGWDHGLRWALETAVEGMTVEAGKTLLELPPEVVPPLDAKAGREVAPLRCAPNDASCARSLSYIERAEAAFDDEARLGALARYPQAPTRTHAPPVVELPASVCWTDDTRPATFDEWVGCVAAHAPRTRRYAETRLVAPDRGWLVLRGRRGHYQFAEELRAYDLATGAAYVAREVGAIVVRPDPATRQGPDAYVGRVAPDQLRELAFVLLTRQAIVAVREEVVTAVVPDELPRTLSDDSSAGMFFGGEYWASSGQTRIAFAFDDGALRRTGEFTWPSAQDPIDTYVDRLVRVMEAGLVRGCAPAKLPPVATLAGDAGRVSSVDADPSQRASAHRELERRLDGLRPQACRGAK